MHSHYLGSFQTHIFCMNTVCSYSQASQYEQLHLHSEHIKLMQCPSTCSAFDINDVLYLSMTGYETKSNGDDEKNDERFHSYVPAMSQHRRL